MKRALLALAQACLLAAAPPLTPEWLLGEEAKALTALPRTAWLRDGSLLLQDPRLPAQERILERLDPATGARRPALDGARALAALRALAPGMDAPPCLPFPESLDDLGRRALLRQGERLFLLDLAAATVRALPGAKAASLSPDGARVAFVRNHDLFIQDLATGAETRLTRDGSATVLNGTFSWVYWEEVFNHREEAFWWSPDSRSLAFLRSDEAAVPLHSFTDFQPTQARVVAQRYPQAGQPNPSVRLGIASAGDGKVAWMDLPAAAYEYVVRVTWPPAGDRVAVETLNRAQDTLDLHLVDRATGRAARILREQDPAWVHFYEPVFLQDGKHFLWASDRTGYNHLYRYTLDGQLVNAVTHGTWSLMPWGMYSGGRTGVAGVDEARGWVTFTCDLSDGKQRQVWKVRLDGTGLRRISLEPGTHAVSLSPDGRHYLDTWSSATEPPSLVLRGAEGEPERTLAQGRRDLDLPAPWLGDLPAPDGFRLPISIIRPEPLEAGRRYPVIFDVYGGPGYPTVLDRWGGFEFLLDELLVAQGYVVISVDNRSSSGLGAIFEKPVKGRLYGDVELKDLLAAVAWAKAQPWADPQRVGIWGWSGGGTYTLSALTRSREFKAGIAVAPVTDWRYYDSIYTELAMKLPADNPEGYAATSQVATAKDLHGRLLLVHGSYDDNVHPQNAQAFMDQLIQAGITFDCVVYPMRQHTLEDDPARVHLAKTMLEFWKRYL